MVKKSTAFKKLSYMEQPCDRCGSKRIESTPKSEDLKTTFGSTSIEVTVVMCTNDTCQESFERQREKELVAINNRKLERETRNKERQTNIANTLATRKEFKFGQKP